MGDDQARRLPVRAQWSCTRKCFLLKDGEQSGPHAVEAVRTMVANEEIDRQQLVWREGLPDWRPLDEVIGFDGLPPLPKAIQSVEAGSTPPLAEGNGPKRTPAASVAAIEFPVQFGTKFIPSSSGFRGDGVMSVSPTEVEIRGYFALPLLVECIGAMILILLFLSSLAGKVGGILVYIAYRSIKTRRRLAMVQLTEVQRLGDRIILRFRPEAHMRDLTLRALSEAVAQKIEQALRSVER